MKSKIDILKDTVCKGNFVIVSSGTQVGFMTCDRLATMQGKRLVKVELSAAVDRCTIDDTKVLLVKPMTFMNNSGEPLSRLAKYYKVILFGCKTILAQAWYRTSGSVSPIPSGPLNDC